VLCTEGHTAPEASSPTDPIREGPFPSLRLPRQAWGLPTQGDRQDHPQHASSLGPGNLCGATTFVPRPDLPEGQAASEPSASTAQAHLGSRRGMRALEALPTGPSSRRGPANPRSPSSSRDWVERELGKRLSAPTPIYRSSARDGVRSCGPAPAPGSTARRARGTAATPPLKKTSFAHGSGDKEADR
jgi:hypothetical protein